LSTYLRANETRGKIISSSSQVTITNINQVSLSKLLLPLSPFLEQRRIVAKIEELFTKLDAGVDSLEKTRALLKRYRQSILKAAVEGKLTEQWRKEHKDELEPASKLLERILKERREKWEANQLEEMMKKGKLPKDDKWKKKYKEPVAPKTDGLPELPKGWVWTGIGSISYVKGGKRLPKGHTYSETPTMYPYIRVTDFENMSINQGNLCFLKSETHHIINSYTISKDDVYSSIAGASGKVGLIPENLDGANLTENAAKIVTSNGTDKKFLSTFLNSSSAQEQIKQSIITAFAVVHVGCKPWIFLEERQQLSPCLT